VRFTAASVGRPSLSLPPSSQLQSSLPPWPVVVVIIAVDMVVVVAAVAARCCH